MKWLLAAALLALFPMALAAQEQTTLTVTGLPITFRSPTPSDLANGYVPTTSQASFNLLKGKGAKTAYVTLYLSCQGTCPSQGDGTNIALQWRLVGTSTWTTMSVTPAAATPELTVLASNNTGVTGSFEFQMLVNFATPTGARVFTIVITQSVRMGA